MADYLVLAVLFILAWFFLKYIIDSWREYKRQKRLELYHRAELIGRKRYELSISDRSKARF